MCELTNEIRVGITRSACGSAYGNQGTLDEFWVRWSTFHHVHVKGLCGVVRYEPLADRMTCKGCGVQITSLSLPTLIDFSLYHHQKCKSEGV